MMSEIVVPESKCILGDQLLKVLLCLLVVICINKMMPRPRKAINILKFIMNGTCALYILFTSSYLLLVEDGTQSALDKIAILGYISLTIMGVSCLAFCFVLQGEEDVDGEYALNPVVTFEESGFQIAIPLVLLIVVEPIIVAVLSAITSVAAMTEQNLSDCNHFAYLIAGMTVVGIMYKFFAQEGSPELSLSICRNDFRNIVVFGVVYLCADFLLWYTGNVVLDNWIDFASASNYQTEEILNGSINWQILEAGIVGPFVEELVFRFGLFGGLRKKTGFWKATFLSAAIFGALHANLVSGLSAFGMGIACCAIYERTQKVIYPAVLHMVANLISVLSVYFSNGRGIPQIEGEGLNLLIFVIALLGMICAIWRYCKQTQEHLK